MNTWEAMQLQQSNPELFGQERVGSEGGYNEKFQWMPPEQLSVQDLLQKGAAAPGRIGELFTALARGSTPTDNTFLKRMYDVVGSPTAEERAWLTSDGKNWWQQYQTLKGSGAIEDTGSKGMGKIVNTFADKVLFPLTKMVVMGSVGMGIGGAIGYGAGLTSGQGLFGLGPELGLSGAWGGEAALTGGEGLSAVGGAGADTLGFSGSPLAGSSAAQSPLQTFGYGNLFDSSLAGIPASSMAVGGADVLAGAAGTSGLFDLAGNAFSPSNLGQLAVQGGSTFGEAGGGSWLDDVAGTAKSFLGSDTGKIASSLAGGLLNYMGVKEATSAQQKAAEELADLMLKNGQVTPSTVNTPWGSASVYTDANGNIIANASEPKGDLARYISGLEQGLGTFNPEEYANKYIGLLRDYARPEEDRLRESLESRLLNRGMMGTESGARLFGKQEEAFSQTDLQRQLEGDKQGRGIYESYLNNLYQMGQYPSGLINPAISLGLKNANNLTGGLGAAAEPLWYSGMNSGLAWGNLLQSLGDQVSSLGTSSSGSSTPNYTLNAGGTGGLFSGTGYNGKSLGYWGAL